MRLIGIILCVAALVVAIIFVPRYMDWAADHEDARVEQTSEDSTIGGSKPEDAGSSESDSAPIESPLPPAPPHPDEEEESTTTEAPIEESLRTPPFEDYDLEGALSSYGYSPYGSAEDAYVYVNSTGRKIVITICRHAENRVIARVGDGQGNTREFGRIFDCPESLDYSDYRIGFTCWPQPEGHRSQEELEEYYTTTDPYVVTDKIPEAAVEEIMALAARG